MIQQLEDLYRFILVLEYRVARVDYSPDESIQVWCQSPRSNYWVVVYFPPRE